MINPLHPVLVLYSYLGSDYVFSKFHGCCLTINELCVVYSKILYVEVSSFVQFQF